MASTTYTHLASTKWSAQSPVGEDRGAGKTTQPGGLPQYSPSKLFIGEMFNLSTCLIYLELDHSSHVATCQTCVY